jgi:hypothetical protein
MALGQHQFGELEYVQQMGLVALQLVMAGHQRSPVQVLQEMGALPMLHPLPPSGKGCIMSLFPFLSFLIIASLSAVVLLDTLLGP